MLDAHLVQQLTASRVQWLERTAPEGWHEWLARTARNAYRGRAPAFASLRIHSLPGCLWEVLKDKEGAHHLIADDELTATLAELRLLSLSNANRSSSYDKSILMLADAFRVGGDTHRYALCLGWALPRAAEIQWLRHAAFQRSGNSAETMIVLLHEVAHRVLAASDDSMDEWRRVCEVGVQKVLAALSEGGHFRHQALADGLRHGLPIDLAKAQISTYLEHLRSNEELLEELTCDLLAVMSFLNLNSPVDVIADVDAGPTGMTTKEVGDALLVAHGAIQNMQLLTAVQAIATSASCRPEERGGAIDRSGSELTARSTVLVFLLSNLLQMWCERGHLRTEWPSRTPNAKGALLHAVKQRNEVRASALLDPLEDLDGIFHEPERYAAFERAALERLKTASVAWPGRRKTLDTARWSLTFVDWPS